MPFRFLAAILLAGTTVTLSAQASTPSFELIRDTTPLKNAGTIVQGDFNNDGKPDIVIGGGATTPWELTLRLGNGDGTFQPPTVIATTNNTFILDLAAVDLNHDGNLDLVAVLQDSGFEVWYGNGNGTFQSGTFYATSTGPLTVAPGDFTGNGLLDIAIGDDSGNVELWNNSGGKAFVLSKTVSVSGPLHLDKLRSADLDGDGITDLVAFNSGAVWALWNNGSESFTVDQLRTYVAPSDMNVGDLNGDGRDDIVVSYDCSASTSGSSTPCAGIDAWYGQGDQKLVYRQLVDETGTGVVTPGQIWPVDVNGDGIGDIVGLSSNSSGNAASLAVWLGKSDGSFSQTPEQWYFASNPTDVPSGEYVGWAMTPGDFNRHGMVDFVATIPPQSQMEIFLNGDYTAPCTGYTINDSVTDCLPVNNTYLTESFPVEAHAADSNSVTALQQYINGKLAYSTSSDSFTHDFSESPGSYLLVTKAWDSTGLSFRAQRNVIVYNGTPGLTCAVTSGSADLCFPQVHTMSGGDPVFPSGTPVQIMGNGHTPAIPTAAQLYINGSLVVNNQSCTDGSNCQGGTSLVDTTQSLSPGTYDLVYKLWDTNGDVEKAQQTIIVQ